MRAQIAHLDDVTAQARVGQDFSWHALHCPTDHPVRECPMMTGALDRLVDGMSVEELASEHGGEAGYTSRGFGVGTVEDREGAIHT